MNFVRYKDQIPVNLEAVRNFSSTKGGSINCYRILFRWIYTRNGGDVLEWKFKSKEERDAVYEDLINNYSIKIKNQTIETIADLS